MNQSQNHTSDLRVVKPLQQLPSQVYEVRSGHSVFLVFVVFQEVHL